MTSTSATSSTPTPSKSAAPAVPQAPAAPAAPAVPQAPAAPAAPAVVPAPGVQGADGSTGNQLSAGYCAQNEDPGCPAGSYVGPNAIPNPDGSDTYVPCEGTICTNPDQGANTDPDGPPAPGLPGSDTDNCDGTICTNPNNGGN
ncbi:hypothetical protein [Rhodococcus sp. PAMC28707]|uniref:hypothetical protein n=1 Tax=Rhodococcus sp. PAMC28707 TaxID=2565560 RepID=UPI001447D8ED|nr:hypothetical protein [Rhodococcus sp. PAMC28707]